MSTRQHLSRRLNELRKWGLTPLGAALLVAVVAVAAFAFIVVREGDPSQEEQIRAYFASSDGGGAPRGQAKLIDVRECNRLGLPGDVYVVRCTIEHRGETFRSCFDFRGDRLLPANRAARNHPECGAPVVWNPDTGSLIAR